MDSFIVQASLKVNLIAFFGSLAWHLLDWTYRWEIRGAEKLGRKWAEGPSRIIVFWHGHQIFMPKIYRWSKKKYGGKDIFALISEHSDGRIAAGLIGRLGLRSIAGSSSKGGAKALIALIKKMKLGNHTSVTPDGPKGPLHEVKPGVIRLAQRSSAPLVPTALGADRFWQFNSWDRMILPKPFARVSIEVGEFITIPKEVTDEELLIWTQTLRQSLQELSERAFSFP